MNISISRKKDAEFYLLSRVHMPLLPEIWRLLAGIVVFLLGMKFLEESLQQLAGRSFKLFLKKQTSSKPGAVLSGAAVTAIVQSSSVVNLIVLAFAGAGIIQMQNALAVMMGSNLGTTVTNWWVALIGFRFNLESFALPIVGLAGMVMLLVKKESRWQQGSRSLLGFGFLFVGLGFIKSGMEDAVKQVDFSLLNQYPPVIFLLSGFLITTLIQSSSATVAIVLSALYSGAISLYTATAIVLGSETGTTIKLLLASVNGPSAKKRVALGNFLFNIITALPVFVFLLPVNRFITHTLNIKDNLLALVFFQSLVNIAGIILFYPFLKQFGQYLEKRFVSAGDEPLFIRKVNPLDTELAATALENEVKHIILCTVDFARNVFDIPERLPDNQLQKKFHQKSPSDRYDYIKHLHGGILSFTGQLIPYAGKREVTRRAEQLISASRNTMYAAKNIKDALPDILQLRNSSNDIKYNFYRQASGKLNEFCMALTSLLLYKVADERFENLSKIYRAVTDGYTQVLHQLYRSDMYRHLSETEVSTLFNFNREMYTAYKSFVFAAKDYLLDEKKAAYFDELPGFIR